MTVSLYCVGSKNSLLNVTLMYSIYFYQRECDKSELFFTKHQTAVATKWQCFKVNNCCLVAIYEYVVTTLFWQREMIMFSMDCSCHWSFFLLSDCRCHDALKLSRAQLSTQKTKQKTMNCQQNFIHVTTLNWIGWKNWAPLR